MGIALELEHVYNALGEKDITLYKKELKFYQELRASVKLRYSDTIDHKEYEAKMQSYGYLYRRGRKLKLPISN
ncbi:hypothetical protein DP73_17665 [Desulfosporosinus sp. HMP52]|nr:hypothetical protein DP73_17665 [Desulfosporosinus sp. HMP52]